MAKELRKLLPKDKVLDFPGFGKCFCRSDGFRPPKKGEFYLSGAIPQVYVAPNDLTMDFMVLVPTYHALPVTSYWTGNRVNLESPANVG